MSGRRVYLEINDDRAISFPASKYTSLVYASQVELEKIGLFRDGREIRWDNIDEVIQVADVARSVFFHTPREPVLSLRPGAA